MLIRALFLKVINNERKTLTHHDTIDHNAAHIVQINKPWIHPNLRQPNLSFVYSSKLTYFCIVDILVCLLRCPSWGLLSTLSFQCILDQKTLLSNVV